MPDTDLLLQFLVNGVGIGCVYGLIGIGFCVIYNASAIVNFAQGAFVMLGGLITQRLMTQAGLGLIPAAALSIILVAAAGAIIERLVIRPLWRRQATMFVMILATLAVQIVIERLTLISVGDAPLSLPNFTSGGPWRIGPVAISYQLIWIFFASLVLVIALGGFFNRTRLGRAMRACAINAEAASLLGIPVSRLLTLSFALSAALGAVAGILVTPTQYTAYNVGVPFAISGFIAAILGGFGNAAGAFLGGIMLGVAQSIAIISFGAGTKNVVALAIMLAFLLFRPTGLLGTAKAN